MRSRKPKLKVTGNETVFECAQTVMAALTMSQDERLSSIATEAVLQLPPERAVHALWIILNSFLSGFDSPEEIEFATQMIAATVAAHEKTFAEHLGNI
jgi:hypothetical protein